MAYTKSQFVLSPNTAPASLSNAVGRSTLADAASAATNIIGSIQQLKGEQIKNESAETSLQTRILSAEAADHNRVIQEREVAAAKALRAQALDQSQGWVLRSYEVSAEANRRRLEAGNNIEELDAIRAWEQEQLTTTYEGLIPEAQDRVFGTWSQTLNNSQVAYDTAVYNARMTEFDTDISLYGPTMSALNANTEAYLVNRDMLLERARLENLDLNVVDAAIIDNVSNVMVAEADFRNFSVPEMYDYIKRYEDVRDAFVENTPQLAGKSYLLEFDSRIDGLKQAADSLLNSRIDDGIAVVDKPSFESNLQTALSLGAIRPEEASVKRLEFNAAELDLLTDPDRIAGNIFTETGGRVSADDVLSPSHPAHAATTRRIEEALWNGVNNLNDPESRSIVTAHFDRNTDEGRKIFGQAFDQINGNINALVFSIKDPTTEEGQSKIAELAVQQRRLQDLVSIGGRVISQEQSQDYALTNALLQSRDVVNMAKVYDSISKAGNNVPPLSTSNDKLGQWVVQNVPEDTLGAALQQGALLRDIAGLNEDQVKGIIENSYQIIEVGDYEWTYNAANLLTANGIPTPEVQTFVEQLIIDPTSGLLDEATTNQIQTALSGDNPHFVTVNGVLTLRSSLYDVSFAWTPEQWQTVRDEANTLFGRSTQPFIDKTRSDNMSVDTEVNSALKSLVDNYPLFNSMSDFAAVEDFSKSISVLGQAQTEAGAAYSNALADGVPESRATDAYLAESVPNVMGVIRASTGNSLSADEYNTIKEYLLTEGKAYTEQNSGMFTLGGDGLFEHLVGVGMRYSGANDYSQPERIQAAVEMKRADLEAAQQRLSEATGTNERALAQGAVRTAQRELDAAMAGDRYIPSPAVWLTDGTPVQPFYKTDTTVTTDVPLSAEASIAQRNLSDANARINELTTRLENMKDVRSRMAVQDSLNAARAAQAEAQMKLDALTYGN